PGPSEPPPTPKAAPAEPPVPTRFRFSGRTLIGALIGVVVALAAVLAIVLATRGSSNPTAGGAGKTSTFPVSLSSAAEVPKSVVNNVSGTADVKIDGPKVCWTFRLKGVDKPTAAHIHQGGPTVSGPVAIPLGGAYKPS